LIEGLRRDVFVFAENWSKVVVASVAPVVVISASGLLCLAFYNRLAAIVSTLRAVQRERLQKLAVFRAASIRGDSAVMESHGRLLNNLGQQTARIIKRAHLIRLTLLCLLAAISFLIITSLLNGVALVWAPAAVAAALTFALGMISLLTGIIAAMRELSAALDVVKLESDLVSDLIDYDVEMTCDGDEQSDGVVEIVAR